MERPANLVSEATDAAAYATDAPAEDTANGSSSNNGKYFKVRDELRTAARTADELEQEVRGDLTHWDNEITD